MRRRDEADGLSLKVTRCETSYDSERKRLENVLSKIAKDLANIENDVAAVRQTSESNVSETETALHSCQVTFFDYAFFPVSVAQVPSHLFCSVYFTG